LSRRKGTVVLSSRLQFLLSSATNRGAAASLAAASLTAVYSVKSHAWAHARAHAHASPSTRGLALPWLRAPRAAHRGLAASHPLYVPALPPQPARAFRIGPQIQRCVLLPRESHVGTVGGRVKISCYIDGFLLEFSTIHDLTLLVQVVSEPPGADVGVCSGMRAASDACVCCLCMPVLVVVDDVNFLQTLQCNHTIHVQLNASAAPRGHKQPA
jgi:hypothetical protein